MAWSCHNQQNGTGMDTPVLALQALPTKASIPVVGVQPGEEGDLRCFRRIAIPIYSTHFQYLNTNLVLTLGIEIQVAIATFQS